MFIEQQQNLPMQLAVWVQKGECCIEPSGWVMSIMLSHELLSPCHSEWHAVDNVMNQS